MALLNARERHFAEIVSRLINTNPFLGEWVDLERKALGPDFKEAPGFYSRLGAWKTTELHPNVEVLFERIARLAEQTRQRLAAGARMTDAERPLYEALALFHLYNNCFDDLNEVIDAAERPASSEEERAAARKAQGVAISAAWKRFRKDYPRFFFELGRGSSPRQRPPRVFAEGQPPEHMFACFFQMRRAFHHIYNNILGSSKLAAQLRGAVWQSIFTHDLRRWSRTVYERMGDLPTLITGPSGTGKELVARAVGLSRYIPFDSERERFETNCPRPPAPDPENRGKRDTGKRSRTKADPQMANPGGSFYPLNPSALAPTLIESELFGHMEGAFTGAVENRWGKLDEEVCDRYGTVFLDEIGELDAGIQVKLLRVLQDRKFQRLGENEDREFVGKIVAATNRDLAAEMRAGRFREDFYYRLCADRITTPSLREQLAEAPDDLYSLLVFRARKEIGDGEAEALAAEVQKWVDDNLGRDYPWLGNFRELEQCVRSIMIRQTYERVPAPTTAACDDARQELAAAVAAGALTADELTRRYFTLVFSQMGSKREAAEYLGCDSRTLSAKIDPEFLRRLRQP
jgi:DNA-binding NtrC family response regulator